MNTRSPYPKLDLHETSFLNQFPFPTTEACVQKRGFVCARRMERYLDPDLHHSRTHDPPQRIYLLDHILFEVNRPILHYPS
jgi:hypothetical protein